MLAFPRRKKYDSHKPNIAKNILRCLEIDLPIKVILSSPGFYILRNRETEQSFKKIDFHREIKRLAKSGYVALTKKPDGWLVRLKKSALRRLKQIKLEELSLPSTAWDGKWRLFIFDIPEKDKSKRDVLSRKLKDLGMYNIQRSVFAYPFDCRGELEFISDYYNLSPYTTYAEVNKIDIDRELRNFFKI